MRDKINRIKELISLLLKASKAYYNDDREIMSNYEYDKLYDELISLEKETGIVMANSPTQNVQGVVSEGFKKIKHESPMLSANKTKDMYEIVQFCKQYRTYLSWKLDGLTIVLTYEHGKLQKAVTRGDGYVGEDVTENAKLVENIPLEIPYKDKLILRGEAVIRYKDFEETNKRLDSLGEERYKNARNLASGTIRNLKNPEAIKNRHLRIVIFECVQSIDMTDSKFEKLNELDNMGFETVERIAIRYDNNWNDVKYSVNFIDLNSKKLEEISAENSDYPVDGLVFTYDSIELGEELGCTSKYPKNMLAYKWQDDCYETVLLDIEWNTSRTGLVNPVAIFKPVEIDGTIVSRASLNNVSYIRNLKLGIGDIITVYKANMIIPTIAENLTESGTYKFPKYCPYCGEETELIDNKDKTTTVMKCNNPYCLSKLQGRIEKFVSKEGANIDGLSEKTIEKFIEMGWLKDFADIYRLYTYKGDMLALEGFGATKVNKLLNAIEKSKKVKLNNFINSLGIEMIGKTQSKLISNHFNYNYNEFSSALSSNYDFTKIKGIGEKASLSITSWHNYIGKKILIDLEKYLYIEVPNKENNNIKTNLKCFEGLTFVITGTLNKYNNRDELKNEIENLGGKVSGSISKKTFALINNDIESKSSKNKKAKELGVRIINEEGYIKLKNNKIKGE